MIHLIGNAHLDPAWMWRWDEGFAAFASTCRSALDRIDETDELIFTVSSAACFQFVEQTDPRLFERIRLAVAAGKWSVQGGWWVEPDCNLPSGESFIRQGLYGQSYFYSRFRVMCDTGYCIDSFGHNANLPALLQACGMHNYVFMRPQPNEMDLPSELMFWRATSGAEVLTYRIPLHYSNFELTVREKVERLRSQFEHRSGHPWMLFFGVGNHGGGPTKEQIAEILKLRSEGEPLVFSDPSKYFASIREKSPMLPDFIGELYPHAVGAYSAHAEIKRLNRVAEVGLLRSETLSVISELATKQKANWSALRDAWEPVLLNQFHDTLCGVATNEVLSDVIAGYNEAISIAARHERIAVARIASAIDTSGAVESLVILNPTNSDLTTPVEFELWHPSASERGDVLKGITLRDSTGNLIPTQLIESSGKIGGDRVRAVAVVDVPQLGWNTYHILRQHETKVDSGLIVTEDLLLNRRVSLSFVQSPRSGLNYKPAGVYEDFSDTWGHGITGFDAFIGEFVVTSRQVIESGPIRGCVRVKSAYGKSLLIEDFILYADSNVIEQRVWLNWQEENKVCKLRYDRPDSDREVTWSIPYGVLDRPSSSLEYPFSGWLFAPGAEWGMGIIAPTKTSAHVEGNCIGLTIARSVLYAHHTPPHQIGTGESLRYLDQGDQELRVFMVLGAADWREARMPHLFDGISKGVVGLVEGEHSGGLSPRQQVGSIGGDAILTALKRPNDILETQSLIIRIVNSYGDEDVVRFSELGISKIHEALSKPWAISTFRVEADEVGACSALEDLKV